MSQVGNIEISLVLNGVDLFNNKVNSAASGLGKISVSLDDYSNRLRSAESSSQSFLSKMRDYTIVFGGIHRAITLATDAITSIPRSIIDNNAAIERNKVLLAGLERGVDSYAEAQKRAGEEIKTVLTVSKGMPYSIDAILNSYTKLRVGGVQNTTEAIEALLNTAAKSDATSEQLKHASVAIQQMAGKGVISMEELRGQLGEAIPDAMNIMSRAVGMDMATMVKVISTGSLASKSALELFFREMKAENDGAAYQMSTTWIGIVAQIQKSWESLVTNKSEGSGMFENLKGQLREVNNVLKSNEAKRFVQDIDSSLSSFVSKASAAARAVYDNFNIISSALIGMFAASKISTPMMNSFAAMKAGMSDLMAKNDEVSNHIQRRIQEVVDKRAAESRAHEAYVRRYAFASQAILDAEKAQHAQRMANYSARIQTLQQLQTAALRVNTLTAAMNTMKGAVNSVVGAFGGWATIAVAAIVSVIAYTVQAINKQKELQANLAKSNGFGATQEEMLFAKQKIDDYEKQVKLVKDLEEAKKRTAKLGGIQEYAQSDNPWNDAALMSAKERLATMEKTIELDKKTYENARRDNDQQQRELGSSRYSLEVESKLNDIQRTRTDLLDAQMNKNAKIKDINEKMKANAEAKANSDKIALAEKEAVLTELISKYEKERSQLTAQFDPNGQGFDMSKMTEIQRENFNRLSGTIEKTKDKLRELRSEASLPVPEVELLNQGKPKKESKSASQSYDDNIDVQIAKLREKLSALRENRDAETKSAELEARIANGDFKGKSDEFIASIRAKAKEYDSLSKSVSNYKETAAEIEKVEDGLNNQIMSLTKKAAKSGIDANNPYLQWARSSEGEKEALNERIERLKELGSYTEENIQKANRAAELIAKIDQNNAHDMITEKDKELSKALMSTRQAAELEHQEELDRLAAFEAAVMKMQESPAKTKMLAQIDLVKRKMEAVYDRERDPFKKWLASSEDLADGVNNKLVSTFDGLFDGIAERIVDTTANFGDMVRSLADDLQKYVIKLLMINALKSAIMGTSYGESLSGFFGGSSGGDSSWLRYDTGLSSDGASKFGVSSADSYSFTSDPYTFANGGIMTKFGSLPLNKYANGGVATTPQVAIFGEGRMNEAYVPLPDGRTIPVTMTGGQQAASNIGVSVNVINQSGIQMDAEQSAPRFDGESYIIDVVLNAVSRPGRMRTAIKGIK